MISFALKICNTILNTSYGCHIIFTITCTMKALKISFALFCYLIGFASIIYYFDFFTGFFVPKTIHSGTPDSFLTAVFVNVALIILFGLQHTLMARMGFKHWFKKHFSESLSRSFYILMSSLALGILIYFWQPIPFEIYDVRGTATGNILLGFYFFGWVFGLLSTFEIDHFKLFGVKQALYPDALNENPELKTPFFYRVVRHPIYTGWLLIHWMTPLLTFGHLLLALGITAYIYIALYYEERDLVNEFGEDYLAYKEKTPRLNPLLYPFIHSPKAMQIIKLSAITAGFFVLWYGVNLVSNISAEMAGTYSSESAVIEQEESLSSPVKTDDNR